MLEEVELDVEDDGGVERERDVRSIALVGLHDQPVATRPVGAGAGVGHVTTDDEARRQPGLGEHQHQHRRRGGLPVGAGHGDRPGLGADRRQHPRPRQCRDPLVTGRAQLDVALRDRRRGRDGVATGDEGGVVADVHGHAGGPHTVEHGLVADVTSRHRVAHLRQRDGDRRHPRATDADDMQAQRPGQVEGRFGRRGGEDSGHGRATG